MGGPWGGLLKTNEGMAGGSRWESEQVDSGKLEGRSQREELVTISSKKARRRISLRLNSRAGGTVLLARSFFARSKPLRALGVRLDRAGAWAQIPDAPGGQKSAMTNP